MVHIEESWKEVLKDDFKKPYFQQIINHIKTERAGGKIIYPPGSLIFNAFNTTPFLEVKVVILGQDPYHGVGQAMGLCFSVPKGIQVPPSLQNIFKELKADTGMLIPNHGDLTAWAKQGVLLLNATLTVREAEANSHALIGWQQFTDAVISKISNEKKGVVFLLWGKFAQQKVVLINTQKHTVLTAAHPSPLSAHAGFLGCRHFNKTNKALMQQGLQPIDWKV